MSEQTPGLSEALWEIFDETRPLEREDIERLVGLAQAAREEPFDEAQAWADDAARRGDPELATPSEALPPCPICGKDDLFMGTDGKPGCPHCEVAVTLRRSTPAEALDAERLGQVIYEMGIDDLDLPDAQKLAAHILARLSPHNREADHE